MESYWKEREKDSPRLNFGCIHETVVSGGLGASELLVKHDNAIKLGFISLSLPQGVLAYRSRAQAAGQGMSLCAGRSRFSWLDTQHGTL
ncbi:hypothetical protein PBY51_015231 [Eleginops maclovinus]|uniref:Uncharacterized protein n=1 Tax=Eleginops maclovinus TaxID=56733 RepID=A0AAN7X282_ELEMC|nr:hypothetical protein PBY51_015231 [Eleginops maclovinus]